MGWIRGGPRPIVLLKEGAQHEVAYNIQRFARPGGGVGRSSGRLRLWNSQLHQRLQYLRPTESRQVLQSVLRSVVPHVHRSLPRLWSAPAVRQLLRWMRTNVRSRLLPTQNKNLSLLQTNLQASLHLLLQSSQGL